MSRWSRGEPEIELLVASGALQQIVKAASDGKPLLKRAEQTLLVARAAIEIEPDVAYATAYDAARIAATALLIQQGLRPTSAGGHLAVERALIAQFGQGFREFSTMRRRRNEIEYPLQFQEQGSAAEADQAIQTAQRFLGTAATLIGELGFFFD